MHNIIYATFTVTRRNLQIIWTEPNPIHRDGHMPRILTFQPPSTWQPVYIPAPDTPITFTPDPDLTHS